MYRPAVGALAHASRQHAHSFPGELYHHSLAHLSSWELCVCWLAPDVGELGLSGARSRDSQALWSPLTPDQHVAADESPG